MASTSVSSRSSRSARPLQTDDVVMARALSFAAWARTNARLIIVAAVAALLLVGGVLYYRYFKASREARAGAQFMELAQKIPVQNQSVAVTELRTFIDRFDGSRTADEARLVLARLYLQTGKPREAIPVLQSVADRKTPLQATGTVLLGDAQAEAGDLAAAARTYQRAADVAPAGFTRQNALEQLALVREQQGDFRGAAAAYRQIIPMTEKGSPERAEMEMRAAEMEARAGAR